MQILAEAQSGIKHFNLQSLWHFWPKSIHIIVTTGVPLATGESATAWLHSNSKPQRHRQAHRSCKNKPFTTGIRTRKPQCHASWSVCCNYSFNHLFPFIIISVSNRKTFTSQTCKGTEWRL